MKVYLILMLIVLASILSACSSEQVNSRSDFEEGRMKKGQQLAEDQKQLMQEQREEACKGKAEGDPCTTTSPMGEAEGTCTAREDGFFCMPDQGRWNRE
jgi:Tfp pilus assembly protein PilV